MKKKNLCLLLILACVFIITGCEEEKIELETNISESIDIDDTGATLICTTDYDYTELNYVIGSKYVVFAEDNKVTKIVSREIITSSDVTKLDDFENYLNENHNTAIQYGGYTYDVKREDDKVISDVTIDYSDFDIKKFADDNDTVDKNTQELTVDSVEKQYISLGAECKRK